MAFVFRAAIPANLPHRRPFVSSRTATAKAGLPLNASSNDNTAADPAREWHGPSIPGLTPMSEVSP